MKEKILSFLSNKQKLLSYLPSKRFSINILALIIAISLVFVFIKIDWSKDVAIEDLIREDLVKYVKDTDKDGLADWEEGLWKTDINRQDTDGDGTNDSEEIKTDRNPLVAGPNDLLKDTFSSGDESNIFESSDPEGTMAKELFVKYFDIKKLYPGSLSTSSALYLANDAVKKIEDVVNSTKNIYTESDLIISKDNSSGAIKIYANQLSSIASKYIGRAGEEIEILKNFAQTEDYSVLSDLDYFINLYKSEANDFLKVKVPSQVAKIHLDLINSDNDISSSLNNIKNILEDPYIGAYSIKVYQDSFQKGAGVVSELSLFLKQKGVVFNEKDPGFMLFAN